MQKHLTRKILVNTSMFYFDVAPYFLFDVTPNVDNIRYLYFVPCGLWICSHSCTGNHLDPVLSWSQKIKINLTDEITIQWHDTRGSGVEFYFESKNFTWKDLVS